MKITVEHAAGGTTVIRAAGSGTVHCAGELHAALAAAFAAPAGVVLEVSGVEEIDASFLQILCAAGKSAAGGTFRLEGCAGPLARMFAAAGFPPPPGATEVGTAMSCGHGGETR
ncbi:MAG TPA: STAS domain-containing protein [Geobacteraceae bacterium]